MVDAEILLFVVFRPLMSIEYAKCDVGLAYQPAYNHMKVNVIVHKVQKFDNERRIGLSIIIPQLGDIRCDLGFDRKNPNQTPNISLLRM